MKRVNFTACSKLAWRLGAGITVAGALAGCSGAPEASNIEVAKDEAAMNPVAEVRLEGRTIKFFEPSPGVLLEIEKGEAGRVTIDPAETQLSGSKLYEFLTHARAPQALLDRAPRRRSLPTARF